MLVLSVAVALGASACGARTGLGSLRASDDAGDSGRADAAAPGDAAIDAPVRLDASPVPDEAGTFFCTPGVYYLEVTDDAGTRTLNAPCPNGGVAVPTAVIGICLGEDAPFGCVNVVACGGGGRIAITSTMLDWVPPGSSSAGVVRVDDAGVRGYAGKLTIDNWPGAGGTVAGDYDAGPISGKFCARRE